MPDPSGHLFAHEILAFLTAGKIYVYDPDTLQRVAHVFYNKNGRVQMQTIEGTSDGGKWGILGDMYWTQYAQFRNGQRHDFILKHISDDTMQAFFKNGDKAFLQSHRSSLETKS